MNGEFEIGVRSFAREDNTHAMQCLYMAILEPYTPGFSLRVSSQTQIDGVLSCALIDVPE